MDTVLEYKQNSYSAPLPDHLEFHDSYYSYNSPCDHFTAVPNIAEISGSDCKLLSHLRPCRYLISYLFIYSLRNLIPIFRLTGGTVP